MSSETVSLDVIGNVGKITLNRPAVFNSFNKEMAMATQAALDECATNSTVRVHSNYCRREGVFALVKIFRKPLIRMGQI